MDFITINIQMEVHTTMKILPINKFHLAYFTQEDFQTQINLVECIDRLLIRVEQSEVILSPVWLLQIFH